jgi:hypothetical protein
LFLQFSLKHLIEILSKPSTERLRADLEQLKWWIKAIKFFQSRKELSDDDLTSICSCLQYEFKSKHQTVYNIGRLPQKKG